LHSSNQYTSKGSDSFVTFGDSFHVGPYRGLDYLDFGHGLFHYGDDLVSVTTLPFPLPDNEPIANGVNVLSGEGTTINKIILIEHFPREAVVQALDRYHPSRRIDHDDIDNSDLAYNHAYDFNEFRDSFSNAILDNRLPRHLVENRMQGPDGQDTIMFWVPEGSHSNLGGELCDRLSSAGGCYVLPIDYSRLSHQAAIELVNADKVVREIVQLFKHSAPCRQAVEHGRLPVRRTRHDRLHQFTFDDGVPCECCGFSAEAKHKFPLADFDDI
jgi:hypothetical protein